MKTTNKQARHIAALARHLNIKPDDITPREWEHNGLLTYDAGGLGKFAVGTDSECTRAAFEGIKESLWAFNGDWLSRTAGIPIEITDSLKPFCADRCESANPAILALVEKFSTLRKVSKAAIKEDGRAHFLSTYDGEEREISAHLFAFRI